MRKDGAYLITDLNIKRIVKFTLYTDDDLLTEQEDGDDDLGMVEHFAGPTPVTVGGIRGLDGRVHREVMAAYADGLGSRARFLCPSGLAVLQDGASCVVADSENHRLRKIVDDADGIGVSTIAGIAPLPPGGAAGAGAGAAGAGAAGAGVGEGAGGVADVGPGEENGAVVNFGDATKDEIMCFPVAVAASSSGELVVAESGFNRVLHVTAATGAMRSLIRDDGGDGDDDGDGHGHADCAAAAAAGNSACDAAEPQPGQQQQPGGGGSHEEDEDEDEDEDEHHESWSRLAYPTDVTMLPNGDTLVVDSGQYQRCTCTAYIPALLHRHTLCGRA